MSPRAAGAPAPAARTAELAQHFELPETVWVSDCPLP